MSTNVDDHDSAGSFHGGAQHELSKSAFGSLVAEAVTLDSPEMRVLDVGTGDGYWLYDLRSQLHDPENADLVGTDAAIMPAEQRPFTIPQNMRFLAQSPRDDWPNDIHGSGVRLNDVGMKKSASRIGEGAEAHGKELGLAWLKQLKGDRSGSRSKADTDRFDEIVEQAVEEAESQGFEVVWYAAWAKRSGGDANGAIEMPA